MGGWLFRFDCRHALRAGMSHAVTGDKYERVSHHRPSHQDNISSNVLKLTHPRL